MRLLVKPGSLENTFSLSGYCVYRADRNQFGGAFMLILVVKNNVQTGHDDQFVLPNFVNLETIAVCLFLQNNTRLLCFLL